MITITVIRQYKHAINLNCVKRTFSLAVERHEEQTNKTLSWNEAKPFSQIPGPSSFLLNFASFIPGRAEGLNMKNTHATLNKKYGDIIAIRGVIGRPNFVMTYNPKDFEEIYRNEGLWPYRRDFDSFRYFREKHRPDIYGHIYSLVATQGEAWKNIRGKVNPVMMQPRVVKQYITPVEEVADEFIERMLKLRDANNEMPHDFLNELNKWSLESIARIALDARIGCFKNEINMDSDSQKMIHAVHDFFAYSWKLEIGLPIWKFYKTKSFRKLMNALNTMANISLKKIEEAKIRIKNNSENKTDHEASVLEKLLKIDEKLAAVMAMDMLNAGIDTTSNGAAVLLYFLASNQQCQNKLREEILTILPNKESKLSLQSLNHIPYLRACMKEANRIIPITAGNVRKTPVDLVLSGYQVPKDTEIVLNHSHATMTENQFSNPEKFMPERWLSEEESQGCPSAKSAHPFAFMPFGFGPRSCVGKRFADLEIEILTVRLIRNNKIEWHHGEMEVANKMITHPLSPLKFKVTEL